MDDTPNREYNGLQHQLPIRGTLTRLSSEIDALIAREDEYRGRIEELTTNLDAFRAAYNSSQLDNKKYIKEKTVLLAELQALKGLEKRVICLLDGDGTIFSADLMNQGQEGGLEAARMLTEKIRQYLSSDHAYEQFHLWVYLFYNKRGLLDTFGRVGLTAAKQRFEDFIMGFNQAAERFVMVDVGGSKEAADAKIKVHLEDNIRLPQTYKIIFGGSHDNGYVNVLRSVITAGFREKLIIMPGYNEVATDIKALVLPELRVPNLFMTTKLAPPSYMSIASGPPPGLPATPRLAAATAQVFTTPGSPGLGGDVSGSSARRNSIQNYGPAWQNGRNDSILYEESDGSVSTDAVNAHGIAAENPAPCTLFYLAECRHGSECKYGHDFILEAEHYEELRENAKKTPCKAGSARSVTSVYMVTYVPKERLVTSSSLVNANSRLVGVLVT
ncbi:hypothetical protein BU15DRAFT_58049 [Melanogaster broomeanus]|nr:hypothetical protein BU15DRAFT_58049 [Melanogaster broomeanus]